MQSSDAVKQQTPITHVAENGINTACAEQFAYGGTRPRVHYERDSCASLSAEMFRKHDCGHQGTECTFRSLICCVERISSDNTDGSECRHSDALAASGGHPNTIWSRFTTYRCLSAELDLAAYSLSAGDDGSALPSPFVHLGSSRPPPRSPFTFSEFSLGSFTRPSLSFHQLHPFDYPYLSCFRFICSFSILTTTDGSFNCDLIDFSARPLFGVW